MEKDLNKKTRAIDDELTAGIIKCAYHVSNVLGIGFLEKVYENALKHELTISGFQVKQQYPIPVFYKEIQVGDYYADLVVNNTVIIELKVSTEFNEMHFVQCSNYLRATGFSKCLLLNFGNPQVEVRRLENLYI